MKWRNTWILVGVAAALFAFIFLFERHLGSSDTVAAPQPLLGPFKATTATSLQLRKGNTFVINLAKTNGGWQYTSPFVYPAAGPAVQTLLDMFDQLIPVTYITPQELLARKQTRADFGFDAPTIAITLQSGKDRQDVRFGARTPGNDQIYVDVVNMGETRADDRAGVYVVGTAILDRLPKTQDDWRDRALLPAPVQKIDQIDITRASDPGFALQRDQTNKLWRLTRPSHRADQLRIYDLLTKIEESRIAGFISDGPADLDAFGLAKPQAELTVGSGSVTQRLQFGRSPTNDATLVYARQVNHTNVVLVPRKLFDLISSAAYSDFRDQRLVTFAPETVDTIEVQSQEPYVVKRQPDGTWTSAGSAVEAAFVNDWVVFLSQLRVGFAKEVVTDFAQYGLAPPRLKVTLRATTNVAGFTTNLPVAQLEFGTNETSDTVFVRRTDESSVYRIHVLDFLHMPAAAWQLRDHRVWSFTTNQVVRVSVQEGDRSRQLIRQPKGSWVSTTGEADPFGIEETMLRLGELRAVAWVARGEAALARYGFSTDTYRLSVEVKDGEKTRMNKLQFAGLTPLQLPYAAVMMGGEPWVFEFPWALDLDLQRYLLPSVRRPTITSFSPPGGAPGSIVIITGTRFAGTAQVRFNGVPAQFNVDSPVQISAQVPEGATTGRITVVTPVGTAMSDAAFTVTGGGL